MNINSQPIILRDFSKGVYRKSAVAPSLVPQNSVSHSMNVNYDTTIGKGVVRPGTTILGSQVVTTTTASVGLTEFVPSGSTSGLLIAAFNNTSTAALYYYNGAWNTSGSTGLNLSSKNRFATLGGLVFRVNGVNAMTSSADGNTWGTTNCITTDSVIPSLIFRSQGQLLASGYSSFRDRVYFSSVINPNASPTLTWNTNPTTGNWIDINPDDNSNVTGFAETSGLVLVFKGKGMYRLNAIAKTVDTTNVFNIGAPSQEAIVNCQGVIYFYSGTDIRQTSGDIPQQISRLGVQDFLDAIPQANQTSVVAGTDGLNVYFSIGTVTLDTNKNTQTTYNNVVLKFSVRDQSWSVHSYATQPKFYAQYTTTSNGRLMQSADDSGNVQQVNLGTTDNGTAISYRLETQEQELGVSRSHTKQIGKYIVVYTANGLDSQLSYKSDDNDFKPIKGTLENRVNILKDLTLDPAHFYTFAWSGESSGTPPRFDGLEIPEFTDVGLQ